MYVYIYLFNVEGRVLPRSLESRKRDNPGPGVRHEMGKLQGSGADSPDNCTRPI